MKPAFEAFLAVAEKMSVTRASEDLHVTQQCVSDHIRRLEQEYGVRLFERRPKLQLTDAGLLMQKSLQSVRIIEGNLQQNMASIARGSQGSFSLGISTSRAPIILPNVLSRYYSEYPQVSISFAEDDTQILEERLLAGRIDLFIGINTTPNADFEIETVAREGVMLVISRGLLKQYFTEEEIEKMRDGVDLERFSAIPFTLFFQTGKVNHAIEEYLNSCHVALNVRYNISDSRSQIALCTAGVCAAICPKMLLQSAYQYNLSADDNSYLYMFPVLNFGDKIHIELVGHKNAIHPTYMKRFMEVVREEVRKISDESGFWAMPQR